VSTATPSIGLVTLNAKYIHLALSLRYLRNAAQAAGFRKVWLREYTLRSPLDEMATELAALRPDILGFSVYIWNRELTFSLIQQVKRLLPAVTIVIGGPEVSFEAGPPLPEIDEVIAGEGELKWVEFLRGWADGWGSGIPGGGKPSLRTRARWLEYGTDLPGLETVPYQDEDLVDLEHRLAYVETSRGCPFSCSFCLSALDKKVRFFDDATVKAMIERLVAAGARRIKFLDRTFNVRKSRVLEFFRFLAGFPGVEFHFEVVGDLLDEPMLAFLDTVEPGRFQFEIGVQSADPAVNARVERHQSQAKLFASMARLRSADRVHLHADLIWGLPGEGLEAIRASFETVLALRPHELQLGFLKFLPGAPIRDLIAKHAYTYDPRPPYELYAHQDLPAEQVQSLKAIEDAFDRTYNSGHFRFSLVALLEEIAGWDLFSALAEALGPPDVRKEVPNLETLARHLLETGTRLLGQRNATLTGEALRDLVKLDYFCHHRARRVPGFLQGTFIAEPPALRALRKGNPDTAYVPFGHRLLWPGPEGEGQPRLEPADSPVWLAFAYGQASQGYFFRPDITEWALHDGRIGVNPPPLAAKPALSSPPVDTPRA
jgi:anaerobic magnesium-protoporphyrin IX monomethyl ester cyclase